MAGLSADQLSAYLDDGFLLLEDVLSPADLQPLIDDITAGIDRKAREAVSEGRLCDPFEGAPFDRRLTRISDATDDPSEIEREVTGKPPVRSSPARRTPGLSERGDPREVGSRGAAHRLSGAKGRSGGVPAQDGAPVLSESDGPHPLEPGCSILGSIETHGAGRGARIRRAQQGTSGAGRENPRGLVAADGRRGRVAFLSRSD